MLFHCDAVQTFLSVGESIGAVGELEADLITVRPMINGPKAAGAIYIRAGVKLCRSRWAAGKSERCAQGRRTWPESLVSGRR